MQKSSKELLLYYWFPPYPCLKETRKLAIRFSSSVLQRTEQMLYPAPSFIAEFGGALGLFLGFSFMMALDAAETIINFLTNH